MDVLFFISYRFVDKRSLVKREVLSSSDEGFSHFKIENHKKKEKEKKNRIKKKKKD